jgi:hypothetical protein
MDYPLGLSFGSLRDDRLFGGLFFSKHRVQHSGSEVKRRRDDLFNRFGLFPDLLSRTGGNPYGPELCFGSRRLLSQQRVDTWK